MFAGFLVILASLKFLVLFDWKRGKEMPMRKAFMCGVRQTLPFYDEASMKVYAGVEEAVYGNLK